MNYNPCQLPIANSTTHFKPHRSSRRQRIFLMAETAIMTTATVAIVRFLVAGSNSNVAWIAVPAVLIIAALAPTIFRADEFAKIGINSEQVKFSLIMVTRVCVVIFPVLLLGLLMLRSLGLTLPLQTSPSHGKGWIYWLIYQFMYVAVAEEVFFRGYVQGNILRLIGTLNFGRYRIKSLACIVLSATCFAAAHVIVQGQMISAVTFLPGLILGWLFIRTGSLLAPILFHGLANTFYYMLAMALI
jgi:membrane protease YdiL (CAAX protease family)